MLSGGDDFFEPTMTFHGFRYAEVTGWPGELVASTRSRPSSCTPTWRRTGTFECSDPLLNQLHRNVVWGLRGNVLDVPTDCPQRNERLGWTGDLAVFAPSAAYLYDVSAFLEDWLVDLDVEQQHADGLVPFVVPDVLKRMPPPPGLPPVDIGGGLERRRGLGAVGALRGVRRPGGARRGSTTSMCAHVRRVAGKLSASGVWDTGFQFGDWLDPDAPPDQPWRAKADPGVVATACLHRSARILAEVAALLGRTDDASEFTATGGTGSGRRSTRSTSTPDGTVRSDCTTAYTLAIVFDLLSPELEASAGDRLAELVAKGGHRISTGFAGTPYVCEALARTGHLDDAYALLLQRECPSWLYPVTMGATTVWERWDSMLPDGSINPGEMTSFNHYALGAVADWMHRTVAGLAPLAPGYAAVRFAPRPGGGLTWAAASLETRHGLVAIRWELTPTASCRSRPPCPTA